MYVDVAVCLPLARTFVYKIEQAVEIGCRVVVPFRRREVEGFVIGFPKQAPGVEILSVSTVIDSSPLLRPEVLELCRWISKYYVSPIGEVLKSALPPGISAKYVDAATGVGAGFSRRGGRKAAIAARDRLKPAPTLTEEQACALDSIR